MNNNLSNIKKGKYLLDKNNCIGMPTETVYGLAANAYSSKAISKIFKLKKRPKNNPLIVHYSSLEMLKRDCILNKNFSKNEKNGLPKYRGVKGIASFFIIPPPEDNLHP